MTAAEIKAQWRQKMRQRLRTVAAAERLAASSAVVQVVLAHRGWQEATGVLLYAALPDELDLDDLLKAALAQGKRVGCPAYEPDTNRYVIREVEDPSEGWVVGRYGIREPAASAPEISLKLLDLAMVPGLGFNKDGVRLGRGAGYYDRLLADFAGWKWGVGYTWQVDLDFPGEPQDVAMQVVVTPTGLRMCKVAGIT